MAEAKWKTSGPEIQAIVDGRHADPFKVLGLHKLGKTFVARAYIPGADIVSVQALDGTDLGALGTPPPCRIFRRRGEGQGSLQPIRFQCANGGGQVDNNGCLFAWPRARPAG